MAMRGKFSQDEKKTQDQTDTKDQTEKNSSSTSNRTHLENHIFYMGGETNNITYFSMAGKNQALGDNWYTANATAFNISASAGAKLTRCPFASFTPKQATNLKHAMSAGFYNEDNMIDEKVWAEFLPYAEKDINGVDIIRENKFNAFLAARREKDTRPDPFGFAKGASDKEWASYWNKFTEGKPGERVVTIEKFRQFLENSKIVGDEVAQRVKHQHQM